MPRANRYLREGYTYHLTHRCHDQAFLLGLAKDRDEYRKWLYEGVVRHEVPVYAYCITANHVHVIVHVEDVHAVGEMMQLAAGVTGRAHNRRRERKGAFWEDQYHCTIIQNGQHLRRCIRYVHMNMVRAGTVDHPAGWKWCGHDELVGTRERYRILSIERLLKSMDADLETMQDWYERTLDEACARAQEREPQWTESLAVGSADFVKSVQKEYNHRISYVLDSADQGDTWTIREENAPYSPKTPPPEKL